MTVGQKLSVICGVKNRTERLRQVLPTWLTCPEIDEVIVVDWSSDEPVILEGDRRVVVVRVSKQPYWTASKCHNLALQLSTGHRILKLDADYLLDPRFFAANELVDYPRSFYGMDHTRCRNENEKHLAGLVYARRCELAEVGGYNERIASYGYEDEDLVRRLLAAGLFFKNVDLDTVFHVPHDDDERLAHQPPAALAVADGRPAWAPWNWQPGTMVDRLADRNRHLAEERPWSRRDAHAAWDVTRVGENYYFCVEVIGDAGTGVSR